MCAKIKIKEKKKCLHKPSQIVIFKNSLQTLMFSSVVTPAPATLSPTCNEHCTDPPLPAKHVKRFWEQTLSSMGSLAAKTDRSLSSVFKPRKGKEAQGHGSLHRKQASNNRFWSNPGEAVTEITDGMSCESTAVYCAATRELSPAGFRTPRGHIKRLNWECWRPATADVPPALTIDFLNTEENKTTVLLNMLTGMQRQAEFFEFEQPPPRVFVAAHRIEAASASVSKRIRDLWRMFEDRMLRCTGKKSKGVRTLVLAIALAQRFMRLHFSVDESRDEEIDSVEMIAGACFGLAMKYVGDGEDFAPYSVGITKWVASKSSRQIRGMPVDATRESRVEFEVMTYLQWRINITVMDAMHEIFNCVPAQSGLIVLQAAQEHVANHAGDMACEAIPAYSLALLLFESLWNTHVGCTPPEVLAMPEIRPFYGGDKEAVYRRMIAV